MARLIIATLLSLLLALVSAEGANIDETCIVADDCTANNVQCVDVGGKFTCKCNTGYTAITDKTDCKKSVQQACTADAECITSKCDNSNCKYDAGSTGCLTDDTCISGTACTGCLTDDTCISGTACTGCLTDDTCISGTACTDVGSEKKCTTLIDGACTGTDQSTCPVRANCTSSVCKCITGYTANTAKSACDKNGAAGITASLVLMAAAFLASRFF